MSEFPSEAVEPSAGDAPATSSTLCVEIAFFLPVPQQKAYTLFLNDVDHWWTYRVRDRARCELEPVVGGRWMQSWDGGGALFAIFTVVDPPQLVRISGPLAMTKPAVNVVDFVFEPLPDGTRLTVLHRAFGDLEPGSEEMYESGWKELIGESFHAYVSRV